MSVPALEAFLGLDEERARRHVELQRREPLDARKAVPRLAAPLRVGEMRDESIHGSRAEPESEKATPRIGLVHRVGNALASNRSTRQPRSAAIARSRRSGFTATARPTASRNGTSLAESE